MVDIIDDSEQISVGFSEIPEEKKFPYWTLLGIPLLIPLLKKKKKKK